MATVEASGAGAEPDARGLAAVTDVGDVTERPLAAITERPSATVTEPPLAAGTQAQLEAVTPGQSTILSDPVTIRVVPERQALRRVIMVWATVLVALAVLVPLLSVGFGLGWGWTGFQANGQLWDWLHLLLLPMVLTLLPLWWKTQKGFRRQWAIGLGAVGVVFLVLLLGGYLWGWAWTGFKGNTLWDWLELLVLPVSASLVPLALEVGRRPRRPTLAWATPPVVIFLVLVLGGYLIPWLWTGFRGNTLWDWIQLLLVPFLIPMVVVVLGHRERRQTEHLGPQAGPDPGPG
jgi:hypothetical protein